LVRENPKQADYRLQLATPERRLGQAYLAQKKLEPARRNLERARTLLLELEGEKLLPQTSVLAPAQIATEIATCDTLQRSANDLRSEGALPALGKAFRAVGTGALRYQPRFQRRSAGRVKAWEHQDRA